MTARKDSDTSKSSGFFSISDSPKESFYQQRRQDFNRSPASLERQQSFEDFFDPPETPGQLQNISSPTYNNQFSLPANMSLSVATPDQPGSIPRRSSAPTSPQSSASSSPVPPAKKEKKSHFHLFRRHKHKDKIRSKLQSVTNLSASYGGHPSSMQYLSTPSIDGRDSPLGKKKLHRSSNSLTHSMESEGSDRTKSDTEFVESLVNPTRVRSTTPNLDSLRVPSVDEPISGSEVEDMLDNPQTWLVNITLRSGHNLAIRDRTGSSDPYVKFKCGRFKYRSSVIHRNLNPEWNETFSFKTDTLGEPLRLRVYDHDYGSLDDFMGGQSLSLNSYSNGQQHIIDAGLVDKEASAKGEKLGFIRLFISITQGSDEDDPNLAALDSPKSQRKATSKSASHCSKRVWSGVLSVTLLEGKNLPAKDVNGLSDPYVKFKLGTQKYKSKTIAKTLNPKWMENFILRIYDHESCQLHIEVWDRDFPQSDDYIGSCSIDLSDLDFDKTYNKVLKLRGGEVRGGGSFEEPEEEEVKEEDEPGTIHLLLSKTGLSVMDPSHKVDMNAVRKRYDLLHSADIEAIKNRDVGHLRVKIEHADDLGASDTFAIVEVGNSVVRTQSVYKTNNPSWDKTFHFNVRDIHDELEVTICKAIKTEPFLGKISLPLHRLQSGSIKSYALKDKSCLQKTRGSVSIECEFVYQPIRAGIRTINPREEKLLEVEQKFQRKVLINNAKRVANLINNIISGVQFYKSLFSWENKTLSASTFFIFIIAVLFGQLWMFCLLGAMVFLLEYSVVYIKGRHVWQNKRMSSRASIDTDILDTYGVSDGSDLEDDLESTGKTSIREKFKQLQEILVIVQNVLGVIADMEERVWNLFNWSVPFLCWMAVVVFVLGTFLFYIVPLRYVVLVWGINKFTKRLRKPNHIENNELLDFMSRCPTNKQLAQWKELPILVRSKTHRPNRPRSRSGTNSTSTRKPKRRNR